MPLMPANATTKTLVWSDFKTENADEPDAGTSTNAAYTEVSYVVGALGYTYTSGKYRWTADPTVTVALGGGSWVASFVAKRPPAQSNALLKHEQGHYMLTALFARDYYNELKALGTQGFDEEKAAKAAQAAIKARYTSTIVKSFHAAYDKQVTNPVSDAAVQTKWDTAIDAAKTGNKPIKDCLVAASLITP